MADEIVVRCDTVIDLYRALEKVPYAAKVRMVDDAPVVLRYTLDEDGVTDIVSVSDQE